MKIHFKIRTWEEIEIDGEFFDDEARDKIISKIKSGEITSSNSLVEYLEDEGLEWLFTPTLGTDEQIEPEENDGYSTIQCMDEDDEILFENGKSL
jgi:hypothetical protein